jgi:hypothetical protein
MQERTKCFTLNLLFFYGAIEFNSNKSQMASKSKSAIPLKKANRRLSWRKASLENSQRYEQQLTTCQ